MPPNLFYFCLSTYIHTNYQTTENKMVSNIYYWIENYFLLNTVTVVCIKIWTIFSLSSVDTRFLLVTFGAENDFLLNTCTVMCMKQWTIFI
jgi:hypothetical protein